MNKNKGLLGCLGCFGIIFIGIVAIIIFAVVDTSNPEELTAEEQSIVDGIIADFNAKVPTYVSSTNGIVKSINMQDVADSDTYMVNVHFDEKSWASLTDSEKGSVVATIGASMEKLAAPTKIYMTVYSASVGDTLASPKITSSGYKIVR